MKCSYCGKNNPAGRTTCQYCGKPLPKETSDQKAIGISILVIILILIGIVVVGYALGYMLDLYESGGWWAVIGFIGMLAVGAWIHNRR